MQGKDVFVMKINIFLPQRGFLIAFIPEISSRRGHFGPSLSHHPACLLGTKAVSYGFVLNSRLLHMKKVGQVWIFRIRRDVFARFTRGSLSNALTAAAEGQGLLTCLLYRPSSFLIPYPVP
jgi:hypothetical protein